MKNDVLLTVASLLSILFLTFHLSDEIARGMEQGGLNMVIPVSVLVVELYGALVLAGRRSGYISCSSRRSSGRGSPFCTWRERDLPAAGLPPTPAEPSSGSGRTSRSA
jgi:hypothetical protein